MLEISKSIFDQCSHLHAIVDIQFLNSHRLIIDTILTYYNIYDFQYATILSNKKIKIILVPKTLWYLENVIPYNNIN